MYIIDHRLSFIFHYIINVIVYSCINYNYYSLFSILEGGSALIPIFCYSVNIILYIQLP